MYQIKNKLLRLDYKSGEMESKYIYKRPPTGHTPYQFCVDHGKYYEIAFWSYYARVDKTTMEVTSDRRNVDAFEPDDIFTASVVPA